MPRFHPSATLFAAAAITLLLFLLAASNGQLHRMHWCAPAYGASLKFYR